MHTKGRINLLNGTSSSGKTTLARALRSTLDPQFHYYASDQLADAGFRPLVEPTRFAWREAFFDGFHRSIASFAGAAIDLLVEHIIDFMLLERRNTRAAHCFLSKALTTMRGWPPSSITTDKPRSYPEAIDRFKREGKLSISTRHRTSKYLNNIIEVDHGALKQVIRPPEVSRL